VRADDPEPFERWWADAGRRELLALLRAADPARQRGGTGVTPHSYDHYLERLKPAIRKRASAARIAGLLRAERATHRRAADPLADAHLAATIAAWAETTGPEAPGAAE
jgi:hypothetical protein